jgi:predicted nucleic acid-binding protein
MTLVDTSVWINHLHDGNQRLSEMLVGGDVVCHPLIVGELACGHLQRRREILALLQALPSVERVADGEILFFIEQHRLFGRGLGLVDIHLLASCKIATATLWTMDRQLQKVAQDLGIG